MFTKQLQSAYNAFLHCRESTFDGVPGVVEFTSGIPGPTLGITVHTHGNEPSGFEVFNALQHHWKISERLKRGRILFVVNNLKATQRYFSLEHQLSQDEATKEHLITGSRYISVNMNRLPKDVLTLTDDTRYEVVRTRELEPIWHLFDVGFDIHSTTLPTGAMLISRGGKLPHELIHGMPISIILSNIDNVQIGSPAFHFYGGDMEKPVFAIEAGQHTSDDAREVATSCVLSLLENLGMVEHSGGLPPQTEHESREYFIVDKLMFPDISYDFVEQFQTFDVIEKDKLLAKSNDPDLPPILAPLDGHLIMPTKKRGREKDISEEVAFLSKPVRQYTT